MNLASTVDPVDAASLTRFIDTEVEPHAQRWEQDRRVPRRAFDLAADVGLCRLMVPVADGGHGLPLPDLIEVFEAIAYSDMGFAFALIPHNNLAAAVAAADAYAHRDELLARLIKGESLGAFLLTEPSVGTHASRIETTAITTGSGWCLDGEKAWVTNAPHSDVLRVYAQTEPGSGARGIAAFLVDADQPGVIRTEPYEMLGGHSIGAGGFRFEGAELTEDQLLAPPGIAYRAAMDAIGLARVLVCSLALGVLERALDVTRERLKSRHAFGGRLADQQGLRWLLADVATDIEAARALTINAARAIEADEPDSLVTTAHAKKFAARAATRGLEQCMQALGADGLRQSHPLARHLAGAKMTHYLDGSTEAQNLVIAKALLD